MAFEIEQEKKEVAWMPALIGIFVILFFGVAVYYLFFSTNPLINTLINDQSSLEASTIELERVKISKEGVLEDPVFKSLRPQVAPMTTGNVGRSNPFQAF